MLEIAEITDIVRLVEKNGGTMAGNESMEIKLQQGSIWRKVTIFLEMIKFSHTIFALPFAFTGAILAAGGLPSIYQTFWILMAMVGARTAAMSLNRLIDADIDGRNPRTKGRAIPAGLLSKGMVALFICLSVALMLWAAGCSILCASTCRQLPFSFLYSIPIASVLRPWPM